MIGCYDFCGHYEWTFAWLETQGGHALVSTYWDEAIHRDSQRHARALILARGIPGMSDYWGHTLNEEGGTHHCTATHDTFRMDMHECPSKGFLLRNGLIQYRDYCDHCMGWIAPLMRDAGFVINHEHNHQGQCWWEMGRADDPPLVSAVGEMNGQLDVRLRADWKTGNVLDTFLHTTDPDHKITPST